MIKAIRQHWAMTTGVLGALVSAASLISLIQGLGEFTLDPYKLDILEGYRALTRMLVDWIPLPMFWTIPQGMIDYVAVGAMVTAAFARASLVHDGRLVDEPKDWLNYVVFFALWPFALFQIVPMIYDGLTMGERDLWRGPGLALFFLIVSAAAAVWFFLF